MICTGKKKKDSIIQWLFLFVLVTGFVVSFKYLRKYGYFKDFINGMFLIAFAMRSPVFRVGHCIYISINVLN